MIKVSQKDFDKVFDLEQAQREQVKAMLEKTDLANNLSKQQLKKLKDFAYGEDE